MHRQYNSTQRLTNRCAKINNRIGKIITFFLSSYNISYVKVVSICRFRTIWIYTLVLNRVRSRCVIAGASLRRRMNTPAREITAKMLFNPPCQQGSNLKGKTLLSLQSRRYFQRGQTVERCKDILVVKAAFSKIRLPCQQESTPQGNYLLMQSILLPFKVVPIMYRYLQKHKLEVPKVISF